MNVRKQKEGSTRVAFNPRPPGAHGPSSRSVSSASTAVGVGSTIPKGNNLPEVLIPGSSDQILLYALQQQAQVKEATENKFDEEIEEHQKRQKRRTVLLDQQARRIELEESEGVATEDLKVMLDHLADMIRERRVQLAPEGYQSYTFSNGDTYEGEWKNSRIHGRGVLRHDSKRQLYEGEWFLGTRNGTGTFICGATNTNYSGKWSDGKRHGKGELVEVEGVYRGDFHSGRVHGTGEYIYTDGHVYKGEWVDDLYEGTGTYFLPNGAKYEGAWTGGVPHGRGTFQFDTNHVYVGEWQGGRRHGKGKYTSEQFTYQGDWRYDVIEGHGRCDYALPHEANPNSDTGTHSSGTVASVAGGANSTLFYEGYWKRGVFHGEGILQQRGEIVYAGEWSNGLRDGNGMHALDASEYEGNWSKGLKHGVGSMRYAGGGEYKGQWCQGQQHGTGIFSKPDRDGFGDGTAVQPGEVREYLVQFRDGLCLRKDPVETYTSLDVKFQPTAQEEHK